MKVSGLETRQAVLSGHPDPACVPERSWRARVTDGTNDTAGGAVCRPHHLSLAHILVCHSVDPTKTIASIPHVPGSIWLVFLHSADAEIERKVYALMAPRGGIVFPYKVNRGLARSWNEGVHIALEAGCDAVLLINDDLHFDDLHIIEAGYNLFRSYAAALLREKDDVGVITVRGFERGPNEGMICPQNFSCCVVPRLAFDKIGYFDEAFTPAYFEDLDFARRAILAGMKVYVDDRCLCEHERSSTLRSATPEQQARLNPAIDRSHEYFCNKWGGLFPPTFELPFNDPDGSLAIPLSSTAIGAMQHASRSRPRAAAVVGPATSTMETER